MHHCKTNELLLFDQKRFRTKLVSADEGVALAVQDKHIMGSFTQPKNVKSRIMRQSTLYLTLNALVGWALKCKLFEADISKDVSQYEVDTE